MKKYSETKDSSIAWIGQIPIHWNLIPNKVMFKKRQNIVGNLYSNYSLLSLTTTGIEEKNATDTKGKVPTSYDTYQEVKPNDIVFCLFDLDVSAVFSGISNFSGMITSAYVVTECNNKYINEKFADYYFRFVFSNRFYKMYSKNVRYTLSFDAFGAIKTPVPPREEQDQIVRFLDWKVSEINKLINIKKKQIECLEELKKSIIAHIVTHGLDTNTKMKDVGIKWIGEIPNHWNMMRGKDLYKKMHRSTEDSDEVITCFRDGVVTLRKNRRTTGFTESIKEIGYQGVKKGDLVIHIMDAFAGSIGVSDSNGKGTPVYNVCQAKGDSNNYYYAFLLREMARSGYIQSLYRGIRERSSDFRFEVFGTQFYPVPPRSEQDKIVGYLNKQTKKINSAITIKKQQLEKLKELQTRLISDAVTGKIDVRDIQIPEYEYVEEATDASSKTEDPEINAEEY